jgi:hypothetical protein
MYKKVRHNKLLLSAGGGGHKLGGGAITDLNKEYMLKYIYTRMLT